MVSLIVIPALEMQQHYQELWPLELYNKFKEGLRATVDPVSDHGAGNAAASECLPAVIRSSSATAKTETKILQD